MEAGNGEVHLSAGCIGDGRRIRAAGQMVTVSREMGKYKRRDAQTRTFYLGIPFNRLITYRKL